MKTTLLAFFALVAWPVALMAAPDKSNARKELADAERAFCALAASHGVVHAFESFAAPDAVFIDTHPEELHGREAVLKHLEGTPADLHLTWSPCHIDVSDDGTLGFTYGRYEAQFTDGQGHQQSRRGYFLTIWRRQPDGSWKFVTDTGAPDRPQPPPSKSAPKASPGS